MMPLGFAGAERLRLPPAEVIEKRWLVRQLRLHADTFIHFGNGCNSLYFWTELPPPTAWNATLWADLFTPAQQDRILDAFLSHRNPCFVVQWNILRPDDSVRERKTKPPDPTKSPLLEKIRREFSPHVVRGDIEIWIRTRTEEDWRSASGPSRPQAQ